MRVGIELRQIVPPRSGGLVPYLEGVLRALFDLDREDQFFVYHVAEGYRLPGPVPAHVRAIALPAENFWQELDGMAARDRLDVLFRTFPWHEPIAFPAARQIVLVPDLQHEELPSLFAPEVLAQRRAAFATAIGSAGAIAVLSQHGRQSVLKYHPHLHEIVVMPPAVALAVGAGDEPAAAEVSLLPTQPFFLYPANLWPHKNHLRLFAALARYLEHHEPIALVLTGDPARWDELERACGSLPVLHLGFVSPQLLATAYRRAHALAYFSLYEGFGMPLLEAFRADLPVICSNTTSLPEVGGDAVLTCDPDDTAAMAALMARVGEPELRAQMIRRGRERLTHYDWQRSAETLRRACVKLCQAPLQHETALATLATWSERYSALAVQRADQEQELEARLRLIHELEDNAREQRLAMEQLTETLQESEADRKARLELIQMLDATARERLEVIEKLDAELRRQRAALDELQQALQQSQSQMLELERAVESLTHLAQSQHAILERLPVRVLRRLKIV
jgi:glycosyltransferase involved in cell wall biosynthesis